MYILDSNNFVSWQKNSGRQIFLLNWKTKFFLNWETKPPLWYLCKGQIFENILPKNALQNKQILNFAIEHKCKNKQIGNFVYNKKQKHS